MIRTLAFVAALAALAGLASASVGAICPLHLAIVVDSSGSITPYGGSVKLQEGDEIPTVQDQTKFEESRAANIKRRTVIVDAVLHAQKVAADTYKGKVSISLFSDWGRLDTTTSLSVENGNTKTVKALGKDKLTREDLESVICPDTPVKDTEGNTVTTPLCRDGTNYGAGIDLALRSFGCTIKLSKKQSEAQILANWYNTDPKQLRSKKGQEYLRGTSKSVNNGHTHYYNGYTADCQVPKNKREHAKSILFITDGQPGDKISARKVAYAAIRNGVFVTTLYIGAASSGESYENAIEQLKLISSKWGPNRESAQYEAPGFRYDQNMLDDILKKNCLGSVSSVAVHFASGQATPCTSSKHFACGKEIATVSSYVLNNARCKDEGDEQSKVYVLGFASPDGSAEDNRVLSENRAKHVMDQIAPAWKKSRWAAIKKTLPQSDNQALQEASEAFRARYDSKFIVLGVGETTSSEAKAHFGAALANEHSRRATIACGCVPKHIAKDIISVDADIVECEE